MYVVSEAIHCRDLFSKVSDHPSIKKRKPKSLERVGKKINYLLCLN